MSGRKCKGLIDCNGEVMEAITNVPLLIVNDLISDEAIDSYNKMKAQWASEYSRWKDRFIDFDEP